VAFPHIIRRSPQVGQVIVKAVNEILSMQCDLLEDELRSKLDAVWHRYQMDRNPEVKQKYFRLLKKFSCLITPGKRPPTHDE